MARIGISVTMSIAFRNSVQEFSNVVYYDGLSGTPSVSEADTLIDELVTKLKPLYASVVTFVRGRLWLQTGDKATTEMISQKNLSGTGTGPTVNASMDRERAYLFRLRAGVDSRGNPVYLRKYIHAAGDLGGIATTGSILANGTGFSAANRTALAALVTGLGTCGSGTTQGAICAKSGRLPTAGAQWEAHPFLEHHQLGDQWRAQ
jgi:hypothetical protein